jgi:hypothetical protein
VSAPRTAPPRLIRGSGSTRRLELELLAAVPGVTHAFTLRDADPRAVLREAAGADTPLRTLRQVHGTTVRVIDGQAPGPGDAPAEAAEGDALVTSARGIALAVFVADCLPILACDPVGGGLAAVHAGWRGTVRGVLGEALRVLRAHCGARMEDVRLAIGPGIGPCCFEVGEEVIAALLRFDPGAASCVVRDGGRPRLDLAEANRRQAAEAGVRRERIASASWCTRCSPDLASYRRDGGRAGRMAGLIAWRA